MWRGLGLSVDWTLTYTTIGTSARRTSQRAFLRNLARGIHPPALDQGLGAALATLAARSGAQVASLPQGDPAARLKYQQLSAQLQHEAKPQPQPQ